MCLILIAWRGNSQYPCVVAANRDELHSRPAAPAQWWRSQPPVLAGQDLKGGGTWLGVTSTGRFAALTNYRDPQQRREGGPSRGTLVTSILMSNDTTGQSLDYLREVVRPVHHLRAEELRPAFDILQHRRGTSLLCPQFPGGERAGEIDRANWQQAARMLAAKRAD